MKKLIILSTFLFYFPYAQSQKIEFSDFDLTENAPSWIFGILDNLKIDKDLLIDGSLNPFYLESDFNRDNSLDIALFVEEKETSKKGILIIHGKSFDCFLVGAGKKFGTIDDFSWMKVWKIYREPTAEETTFTENFDIKGSNTVKLDYFAISVAPSEGSSNLIIWDGKNYKWIHTGD